MKFNEFIKDGKVEPADRFTGLLLVSASYFHSTHFETKNYSRHKAYNKFFDAISDLTDKFGEQWLGFSGRKYTPYQVSQSELPTDTVKMLDILIEEADKIYKSMPPAIQSTIDEIVGVCYQTKYLLSLE
ncbi:starvation-inducible transcriptional regulator [Serratia phage CHI14]|uniref:Uncharacterized protein n=2 Tax=Winklervirus chi14 TaxID=2560752 RepID=A0A1Z1LYB6_9CAUD|nr:starvation-inducible transcriptional regulator [Serratia phage CHI14]ARW57532.1 hypothetical protein [Serratia phage CHI14]ARW57807.1 hypothetical protein [Serratia phage CBH8]